MQVSKNTKFTLRGKLIILIGLIIAIGMISIFINTQSEISQSDEIPTEGTEGVNQYSELSPDIPKADNKNLSSSEKPESQSATATSSNQKPEKPESQSATATSSNQKPENPFSVGFSEWYVFNRRYEVGKSLPNLPSKGGNPGIYCALLKKENYREINIPLQYAFVCSNNGGHVMFVEKINSDGSIWISEMNATGQKSMTDTTKWGGWYLVDYRLINDTNFTSLRFYK